MLDRVEALINGKRFDDILSYSADSDLLMAADAFSMGLLDPGNTVSAGMPVELWVNGRRELYGVIDRVESTATKKERTVMVQGRDLMGMLCSHDITEYGSSDDLGGKTLGQLARALLRDIPFVNYMNDVIYEGKAKNAAIPYDTLKAEPGQTVFDLLKNAATGRGLHFWCNEDGKLVFGKPISSGRALFRFVLEKNSAVNNVIEGKKVTDTSEAFSKIFVYGQSEDADGSDSNIEATASMNVPGEFPFYKPKVAIINTDKISPTHEAKRLLNISRAKMLQLTYKVAGHSQGGRNYRTNEMARVDDGVNGVHGEYVICGRTFSQENKKAGPSTTLRLCVPGAITDG
jgi:prophage tail gpP-like protein